MCERERPSSGYVWEDPYVVAFGARIPGWVMLQARAHTAGIAGLDPEQAPAVGAAVAKIAQAMVRRSGDPRVYMYAMCEKVEHFHMLLGTPPVVDRSRDQVGGHLLARIVTRDPALVDEQAAERDALNLPDYM